jgi:hypothetical protein
MNTPKFQEGRVYESRAQKSQIDTIVIDRPVQNGRVFHLAHFASIEIAAMQHNATVSNSSWFSKKTEKTS